MKRFNYRAKNVQGETVHGVVEAVDDRRAADALHNRNLTIISLAEIEPNILSYFFGKLFNRISLTEKATFTRQLSTMITTGLTVSAALEILRNQSSSSLAYVIDDISKNVEGGSSLAEAMSRHPKVFDRVYVALVRAGETAGVLDNILSRLADNLEKQRAFASKVKGAMIYPVIIIVGMIAVTSLMMIVVIPKMMSLYGEFQAELPLATKILVGISNFMVNFWYIMLAIIIGLIWTGRSFRKTEFGRKRTDEIILTVPVFGNLQTQIVLTEMTRTLGLLVGAGISIVEALDITAEAMNNMVFRDELKEASKQVEKGLSLATTISYYDDFPPIVSHMLSVGEETGKMDEVLTKLSHYFEQESEEMVKGLTTAIEPLIMIVLGVGVGFLVMAIILPIYNLTNQF